MGKEKDKKEKSKSKRGERDDVAMVQQMMAAGMQMHPGMHPAMNQHAMMMGMRNMAMMAQSQAMMRGPHMGMPPFMGAGFPMQGGSMPGSHPRGFAARPLHAAVQGHGPRMDYTAAAGPTGVHVQASGLQSVTIARGTSNPSAQSAQPQTSPTSRQQPVTQSQARASPSAEQTVQSVTTSPGQKAASKSQSSSSSSSSSDSSSSNSSGVKKTATLASDEQAPVGPAKETVGGATGSSEGLAVAGPAPAPHGFEDASAVTLGCAPPPQMGTTAGPALYGPEVLTFGPEFPSQLQVEGPQLPTAGPQVEGPQLPVQGPQLLAEGPQLPTEGPAPLVEGPQLPESAASPSVDPADEEDVLLPRPKPPPRQMKISFNMKGAREAIEAAKAQVQAEEAVAAAKAKRLNTCDASTQTVRDPERDGVVTIWRLRPRGMASFPHFPRPAKQKKKTLPSPDAKRKKMMEPQGSDPIVVVSAEGGPGAETAEATAAVEVNALPIGPVQQ